MHLDILKNPKAKKLEELEAVRPTSLLVFIVDRVLSDFTGTQPDLVDTYWEFFDLMNMNAIRDNKDRQEAAIYAFTIVTIIFLPISTVASVFGMNTNDIRNMAQNQWLFWAAALPLTTIVIVVSLIAAGIIPWTFVRKDRAALATAQAEVSEVKMVRPFISTRNTGGVRNRYPSRVREQPKVN
ncbi:hypothetical protein M7I_3229 [Glarea lozoyensis 74030]|uniref:Magnesium transport protein CorA, transmembrane region n=1 Tax=Glarea lozoyensis (strain ATCC 74030 / MF5533) TaxID=1104152 RepID=H0EKZ5_GLAL7|nr:hypothetical protein M7I_3229 [Glarea lozoyensis 74030]